jgi:hypothetical protein
VLLGAAWQRCRVHFLRMCCSGPGSAEMVAAAIRTIFAQPRAEMVRDQLEVIATMLGRQNRHEAAAPNSCARAGGSQWYLNPHPLRPGHARKGS